MSDTNDAIQIIVQWMEVSTTRSIRDWMRYVKTTGLSMPQFGIMMHLFYRDNCGVSDIGGHMKISSAAASQLIDKLVKDGLLERTENPNDRRAKQITLSEKGRNLIETGIHERYRWVGDLASSLKSEEQEAVLETLPVLIRAFQKLETT